MTREQDITICANCKHHCVKEKDSSIWYDWFCMHPNVKRQLSINVVTGKQQYTFKNDLGRDCYVNDPHPNCHNINDGYCALYELG